MIAVYGQDEKGAMKLEYTGKSPAIANSTVDQIIRNSGYHFVVVYNNHFRVGRKHTYAWTRWINQQAS